MVHLNKKGIEIRHRNRREEMQTLKSCIRPSEVLMPLGFLYTALILPQIEQSKHSLSRPWDGLQDSGLQKIHFKISLIFRNIVAIGTAELYRNTLYTLILGRPPTTNVNLTGVSIGCVLVSQRVIIVGRVPTGVKENRRSFR